ncbi:VTT domain-containing protein [Thioclava sp. GXIMD4216]|uniref:VTT domain-containing protein n=1 Tax=Thioclava litoralis TaxID=3076557 RepID=A0ABZ1DZN4_9RHOB|nr:VTT domain-containing protein [Thioclava sp. FTW29]
MFGLDQIISLLAAHGLVLVGALSILEGPIVTVLASWLASNGLFDLLPLFFVLLAGDLIGDLGFYYLGRRGLGIIPAKWRHRLGLDGKRLRKMLRHFRAKGGRTLLVGKITHSAGAAILVAAGISRMPVLPFLLYNLLASIPKTLALMALGYFMGSAYTRIDGWISKGSIILLGVLILAGIGWYIHHKRQSSCPQD